MFFATQAIGATYYIATDGDNGNPGTNAEPWATFQYAQGQVSAGDTVIVKDGTYTENYNSSAMIYMTCDGTSGNWITFKAENKWGAALDATPNGGEEAQYAFYLSSAKKHPGRLPARATILPPPHISGHHSAHTIRQD